MSPTVERLQNLTPDEAMEFYQAVHKIMPTMVTEAEDEDNVQADWDEEIDSRIKDMEEGKVELITSERFHQNIDALFAKLGINRRA